MSVRILICLLLLSLSAPALAQRSAVPGTRLYLDPPAGFIPSPEFPGFINPAARASISVTEIPAPLLDALEAYGAEGLRKKGIAVISTDTFEKDGLRAMLMRGEQGTGSQRMVKLFLVTGDASESVIVTASYAKRFGADLDTRLWASLRDATWDSSQMLDHFDGLGFSLKEVPGLRIATRVSNSVIFTRDGRLPDQYYTGQMLIVGWVKGLTPAIEERRAFAEKRFLATALLTDVQIDNTESTTINGLSGFTTTGTGNHRHLGYATVSYQVVLFAEDGILIAQGLTDSKVGDSSVALFRTVVGTLKTH